MKRLLWLRRLRLNLVHALAAVLLVVLPLLAVMQFTWLEHMAKTHLDRSLFAYRAGVQSAAKDIDEEIQLIFRTLQISAQPYSIAELHLLFAKVEKILAIKLDPELQDLIAGYYWVEAHPGQPASMQRYQADSNALIPIDTARWQSLLDYLSQYDRPPVIKKNRMPISLFGDNPVLMIPLVDDSLPEPKLGWAIIELDHRVLSEALIGPTSCTHICDENTTELGIGVIEKKSGRLFFCNDESLEPEDFSKTETFVELFLFRDRLLLLRDTQNNDQAKAVAKPDTPTLFMEPSEWELMVRHPDGSLAAHVAGLHKRNLLLGSAVFLVLAGTGIMLVVVARRAQRLTRLQQEFIGGVSHELRTPLAVISAAGENLADKVVHDTEDVCRYGLLIQKEGQRLQSMVEGVLQFTRLQSDQGAEMDVPVSLQEVVAEAVSRLEHSLQEDGFEVVMDLAADLPAIPGDQQALLVAVTNLISNARKYGKEERWVKIMLAVSEGELVVSVQDRGPGVDPSDRRRIFQPFYRSEAVREAQIAGAGLGLSIVAEVARHHGGRIEQENISTGGSCFRLHLPLVSNIRNRRKNR